MSGGFNLDDYVDVAERIKLFYGLYPDGRIVTQHWKVEQVGERLFAVCSALAYRTPDDSRPCSGTAWEPIPGPTPYTRDSELMNAETAAWGRAIIAVGIPSKKIASQQEVKARTAAATTEAKVTKAQHAKIGAVIKELDRAGGEGADWVGYSRRWIQENYGKTSRAELTTAEAGQLIDHLEAQLEAIAVPFG